MLRRLGDRRRRWHGIGVNRRPRDHRADKDSDDARTDSNPRIVVVVVVTVIPTVIGGITAIPVIGPITAIPSIPVMGGISPIAILTHISTIVGATIAVVSSTVPSATPTPAVRPSATRFCDGLALHREQQARQNEAPCKSGKMARHRAPAFLRANGRVCVS